MAIVFVLVGQCGTQIGSEVCKRLPYNERTHHADGCVRCVGVDTEPKVLLQTLQNDKKKLFRRSSFAWEESGRGNNWAFGYNGAMRSSSSAGADAAEAELPGSVPRNDRAVHSKRFTTKWGVERDDIRKRAMDAIAEEVRRAGFVEALVFFHSLAGGTGSGLGSRLVEQSAEAFSEGEVMYRISVVVAPHQFGDTAVSGLNSLLTLNHLYKYSSLVLYFNNQTASDFIASRTRRAVQLTDINNYIVRCVLLVLQYGQTPFVVSLLVATLAPHGSHKVATVKLHGSSDGETWSNTVCGAIGPERKGLVGTVVVASCSANDDSRRASEALSTMCTTRGAHAVKTALLQGSWDFWDPPAPSRVSKQPMNNLRHVAVATTCPKHMVATLVPLLNQVALKVMVGAYLHWYERCGVHAAHFSRALDDVKAVALDNMAYLKSAARAEAKPRTVTRRPPPVNQRPEWTD
ncbi:Tubulin gamma-2 chain [Diplonema papillatum]|nr:Tubulin gamma-2 chain [Diplonema papillatum]KAJ9446876.1 Tubulin gamma-2 chain [Diplonema papillatum]KAJ9446877.1 Tubulin gamma-2 chain [Diplonema papillatum]